MRRSESRLYRVYTAAVVGSNPAGPTSESAGQEGSLPSGANPSRQPACRPKTMAGRSRAAAVGEPADHV